MFVLQFVVCLLDTGHIAVVPRPWIFRNASSDVKQWQCYWTSSLEKTKNYAEVNTTWKIYGIKRLIAKKGTLASVSTGLQYTHAPYHALNIALFAVLEATYGEAEEVMDDMSGMSDGSILQRGSAFEISDGGQASNFIKSLPQKRFRKKNRKFIDAEQQQTDESSDGKIISLKIFSRVKCVKMFLLYTLFAGFTSGHYTMYTGW